jgi:hypothetical protein
MVSVIHSLLWPEKKIGKLNKRFISIKMFAKQEQGVTWWKPAAQMCPVLDSSSFVPVPKLEQQNPLL